MQAHCWEETIHIDVDGEESYSIALGKAMAKAKDVLEPDEEIIRHCPERLEQPTWCLVVAKCSFSAAFLHCTFIFERLYPEDVNAD